MKKLALLALAIPVLLLLDGFLTHDIFDKDILSPTGWLVLALAFIFSAIVLIADATTNSAAAKTPASKIAPVEDNETEP